MSDLKVSLDEIRRRAADLFRKLPIGCCYKDSAIEKYK